MADIDLEKKQSSGMGWLWGLIALLLVGAVAWMLLVDDEDELEQDVAVETQLEGEMDGDASEAMERTVAAAGALTVGDLLDDPDAHFGSSIDATARVGDVETERGFWLVDGEGDGERIFVAIDEDQNEWPDVTTGMTLELSDASVRDARDLEAVSGQLDADTREILSGEEVFLTVDPGDIRIVERAGR